MTTITDPAIETTALTAVPRDESRLPRILCVTSDGFNDFTLAIGNLFRGWPKDRLAAVTSTTTPSTTNIFERYYWLGRDESVFWRPVEWLRRSPKGGMGTPSAMTSASSLPPPQQRSLPATVAKRLLYGGDAVPSRARLSDGLESWIEEFDPQFLYVIPGDNCMLELAELIRRRFDLPMAVHFMDDWLTTRYRTGLLAPFARRRLLQLFSQIVRNATVRIGICDEMCTRYSAEYGVGFVPFHGAINLTAVAPAVRKDVSIGDEVRLFYSGGAFPFAQLDSLVDMCRAVAELRRRGTNVRFDIYSRANQIDGLRRLAGHLDGVSIRSPVAEWDAYFRNLCTYDLLVLPVNFDRRTIDYIRYSMPGKLADYLASGVPILVYGPDAVAQVRYAKSAAWAHVVDRRDPDALSEGIVRMTADMVERKRVATTARRLAETGYDAAAMQRRFQATITEAAAADPRA